MAKMRSSCPDLTGIEYVQEFINTIIDMVNIQGLEKEVPKSFIIKALLEGGRCGFYDKEGPTRGFYKFAPGSIPDRYGIYNNGTLSNAAGVSFYAKRDVIEIRANPERRPIMLDFLKYGRQLAACDLAIEANVRASTWGRLLTYANEKDKDAILLAFNDTQLGLPTMISEALRRSFDNSDISVPFVAPQIKGVQAAIYSDAQRRIGTVSGNQYKKERVQSAEVDASIAETIDSIYIMIDTFNEDCERGGLPYRMEYNGYAAKYDEDGQEENDDKNQNMEEEQQ